ncbi:hypothetical protein C8R46DRAFT_1138034 [Mycena filopes]|nr:hypothetical protein C8R46DRAFT_1138034 [Mycena filopes]
MHTDADAEVVTLSRRLDDLLPIHAVEKTTYYPVLTLPVELILEIFCWTLVPPWAETEITPLERPLRLGQICRLWRDVALSTPSLYSTLDIPLRRQIPQSYLSRIQTVVSRTAALPLTISLTAQYRVAGGSEAVRLRAMADLLNILAPHSRAWADISFKTPPDPLNTLSPIHHQLPQLRSLALLLEFMPADGLFGTMFNDAPRLRKLHLSNFGSQKSALPWAQLTSLHLDTFRLDKFAEMLAWTPNVVELMVADIFEGPVPPAIPRLAHLESIIFTFTSCYLQAIILSLLDARPRKLKLGVYDLSPFSPSNPASLAAVECLSVDIDAASAQSSSIEGLTPMSSLQTLKITAHDLTKSTGFSLHPIICRLTEDATFLPALTSLTFILLEDDWDGVDPLFDMVTLSDMLCARWNHGLRAFDLLSRRPLPPLDSRLVGLTALGMQIRLETVPDLEVDFWRAEF